MTTPDPAPGSVPIPDDATSAYDPDAVLAGTSSTPATPWPASEAPWPPAVPLASAPASGPSVGAPPPAPGSVPPSWGWQGSTAPPVPTRRSAPPGLVAGVILVIIGAALLVSRFVDISYGGVTWPLWIVVPGVALLVGSFFIPPRGGLGLAVPGMIVTIVGLVLWVQEVYGLYATWAYAWALVAPTGPGLAMLLYGLVHRDGELVGDGFRTTLVGLGLFLGFALFFEGVIGLSGDPIPNLDQLAPYGIIALGVLLLILSFFGNGKRDQGRRNPQA